MSRSNWAWTKSSFGYLARAVSSLMAIERAATVVMLMLALFPATALGRPGNPHRQGSAALTSRTSRTARAAHSKSHSSDPRGAVRSAHHARNSRELLALGSGYAAAHGSKAVKLLQRRLVVAGFPPGPIDGRYGLLTEHAVIGFQTAHGLQADGIAGPVTRSALAAPSRFSIRAPDTSSVARDRSAGFSASWPRLVTPRARPTGATGPVPNAR